MRPESTARALLRALQRGYVHLRFPQTHGGTEVGVEVDRDESVWSGADFAAGTGSLKLVGSLVLDRTALKCVAEVSLERLSGEAHLRRIGPS